MILENKHHIFITNFKEKKWVPDQMIFFKLGFQFSVYQTG